MKPKSGTTQTIWSATAPFKEYKPLDADLKTEVCVIGGGISGLSTAYMLAKGGKQVVLLEDGVIASGETYRTTAHLSNILDDRFQHMEKVHGQENTRLAADSHTAAINQIEQIVKTEAIDCDFRRVDSYLFLAEGQEAHMLVKELESATRAGIVGGTMLNRLPLGGEKNSPCIQFPRQAQFHVLRYLQGLCRALDRLGVKIFTGTHVTEVKEGPFLTIHTEDGNSVTADYAVVATNSQITDTVTIHTKQSSYRSYVIGLEVDADSIPTALYWDMGDPYHYCRLQSLDGDTAKQILIVGGEDHKVGQADDVEQRFANLESWARKWFSTNGEVAFKWSGQVVEPFDGCAFIGVDPAFGGGKVFVITGDSGMGMTHGTTGAMLVSDMICGRDNPWSKLYEPTRKMLHSIKEFIKENASGVVQYARALAPGEVDSVAEIMPGEGGMIRQGTKLIAVYKSQSGEVIQLSPVCPHLKGVVCWNKLEKSWDCPVHGSRFDSEGKVINGPSNSDLTEDCTQLADRPLPPDTGAVREREFNGRERQRESRECDTSVTTPLQTDTGEHPAL